MPVLLHRPRFGVPFFAVTLTVLALCAEIAVAAETPRAPETVYAKTCGYCHGQHVAPIIRGRGIPPEVTRQYVRSGPRGMVAFRQTEISDAELDALANWLKASKVDPKEKGQ